MRFKFAVYSKQMKKTETLKITNFFLMLILLITEIAFYYKIIRSFYVWNH